MPKTVESYRSGSIGMKLVERLAAQLNASFERLAVEQGTAWKLSMGQ
jgi:two-component sensor histidine kinase